MRVLLIAWEFPPYVVGGIGTHVAQLVPQLAGVKASVRGSEESLYVDVLTTSFAGGPARETLDEYTTVHRIDLPAMDPLDLYNSVVDSNSLFVGYALRLGHEQKYDIIHVHDWLTAEAGIALKHQWHTPLIVTIHATERGRHQGWLPSATSQQIDYLEWKVTFEAWGVVACSKHMRDELTRYFHLPEDKIVVIPNGVDGNMLNTCDRSEISELYARFAPDGEKLLLYIGRITHEKGVHLLVRAMPRILVNHPKTRLLIAGKNGTTLAPLAYELGVERNVDFLGFIPDSMRNCLYAIVSAAIFPSLYEPFGIVALEAMASSCNVIASDTGGLAEVLQNGRTGLIVQPGDPLSIAAAVDYLFTDPEAAAERRAAATHEVENTYRWDHIAALTAEMYAHVHEQRLVTHW